MQSVSGAFMAILIALAATTMTGQQPQDPQSPAGGAGPGGFGGGGLRGQFPPRDTRPMPTGTARIRGRVLAADTGAPLRRAQVRLTSQNIRNTKTATTDTEGRFDLSALPAGRYTLAVSKAGYLTLQYGQRRPLEPGKPIDLSEGQLLDRTDVLLPRGGVVTGRIVDEYGEPLADATVQALRYQYVGGQRQLAPAGRAAQTDDIGQYRIFGLPPGDYYVTAATRTPMAAIQAATATFVAVPPGVGAPFDPAAAAGLQAVREAIGGSDDELTGYAPTYYPGTATLTDAQRVTIGVGEELPGISFSMTPAKLARISGTVVDSQGQALARGMVMIRPNRGGPMFMRSGMNGGGVNGGAFMISGVPPGDYMLQVRSGGPGSGRGGPGGPGFGDAEFANVHVSVNGSDLDGVVIATSKGATVTGRIMLGGARTPANLSSVRVTAASTEADQVPPIGAGSLGTAADGTFELRGLGGPVLFQVANPPAGWTLKAVRLDGADITDTPHEFKGGETITGLEIELTDKPTRINGTVTNNQNDSIKDYAVVVFTDDNDHWIPQSRFVRAGRPDQDGHFQIIGLPPGRYLAVALEYLEQGSEMDPDVLEQLKTKGTSFTLDEGETHQLNLKLSL